MGAAVLPVLEVQREVGLEPEPQRWNPVLRVAFRFVLVYFTLFSLTGQILGGLFPIVGEELPNLGEVPPMRPLVFWAAAHIFHTSTPSYIETGSGDRAYDWILAFCLLVLSAAGTAVWTVLDRKRANYVTPHKWFQLGLRFVIGSELLLYGVIKLVPMQMPYPPLSKLVEPFGDFSLFSVLWLATGASPAYEMFVGSAEIFGALLLFFPRTARFGALVCLADAVEVFVLNMTYDIPVKLLSFHLVVLCLLLLAPELRRMATFFFTDGVTPRPRETKLFRTVRANRIALAVQVMFALFLVVTNGMDARRSWAKRGPSAPQSPLYGIWNVDTASPERQTWRRVIFDRAGFVVLQRADDSLVHFAGNADTQAGTVSLTKQADPKWKARFQFQRAGSDQLVLIGEMDGGPVQFRLKLQDRNQYTLIQDRFHWVQERPFGH